MAKLDVEGLLEKLTIEEKVSLLAGRDFWHTVPIPRLSIPSIRMSDGPNGVRGTRFFNGIPAACVPCGTALGATWDVELLQSVGKLLGLEAKAKGAHVLLGPTVNIQRSPLGGRGFESYSEDPLLSGLLAAAYCKGVQSENIVPTMKHFVCNDMEDKRNSVSSVVSERALREVYLLPFMLAVRDASPGAFMTSYGKLNGLHCNENKRLLEDILRRDWKWDGLVMSDWFGTYSTSESIIAGADIEMPGPSLWRGPILSHAIVTNKVNSNVVDARVRNVLNLINKTFASGVKEDAPEAGRDTPEDRALMRKFAGESIVLLKNDNGILPFKKDKKIGVIGPSSSVAIISGGGSASLAPYSKVTPLQGLRNQAKDVSFSQGCYGHKDLPLLSSDLKCVDGSEGFFIKFFHDPPGTPNREPFDQLRIKSTYMFLMDYTHPSLGTHATIPTFYAEVEGYITPEFSKQWEFSLSVSGTAKLYVDDKLIIDNTENQIGGDSFFGAGTIEKLGKADMTAGKAHKIFITWGSSPTSALRNTGAPIGNGGVRLGGSPVLHPETAIADAVKLAKEVDQVVIFVGLNDDWESEGYDRADMSLPPHTDELISAVLAVNPKAAVVIQSGTPVAMPWLSSCGALLQAWFGGNEGGNAIADVLLGEVNPSAKLPLTFPRRLQDNPAFLSAKSEGGRMLYGEDVFVGYRHYDILELDVNFPFGHGLSYSTFKSSNLSVETTGEGATAKLIVSVEVENTGKVDGAEVVQVYVAPVTASVTRPVRELKGFKKVFVKAGGKEKVVVEIERKYATSFWDELRDQWRVEKGVFKVFVGSSSRGEFLEGKFEVAKSQWWSGL